MTSAYRPPDLSSVPLELRLTPPRQPAELRADRSGDDRRSGPRPSDPAGPAAYPPSHHAQRSQAAYPPVLHVPHPAPRSSAATGAANTDRGYPSFDPRRQSSSRIERSCDASRMTNGSRGRRGIPHRRPNREDPCATTPSRRTHRWTRRRRRRQRRCRRKNRRVEKSPESLRRRMSNAAAAPWDCDVGPCARGGGGPGTRLHPRTSPRAPAWTSPRARPWWTRRRPRRRRPRRTVERLRPPRARAPLTPRRSWRVWRASARRRCRRPRRRRPGCHPGSRPRVRRRRRCRPRRPTTAAPGLPSDCDCRSGKSGLEGSSRAVRASCPASPPPRFPSRVRYRAPRPAWSAWRRGIPAGRVTPRGRRVIQA